MPIDANDFDSPISCDLTVLRFLERLIWQGLPVGLGFGCVIEAVESCRDACRECFRRCKLWLANEAESEEQSLLCLCLYAVVTFSGQLRSLCRLLQGCLPYHRGLVGNKTLRAVAAYITHVERWYHSHLWSVAHVIEEHDRNTLVE